MQSGSDKNQVIGLPGNVPQMKPAFKYGTMLIPENIIFYQRQYIYAMVPLVPKLQGHIMIVPRRQVLNFKDLKATEVFDLGLALKFLTAELEKFHKCTSSTVYIQNYSRTDDKINHMCVHVVTRKKGDLANNDDIYPTLQTYDRDFVMDYNTTIANNDVFSQSKISSLKMIADQYRDMLAKAMTAMSAVASNIM